MAIPYLNIARSVALRANQIGDAADVAALDALFTGALASALAGMDIPPAALKLQILSSEKRLVELIAKYGPANYQTAFYGGSNAQGSGNVPTADASSKEFVGPFTGVFDAVDPNVPLTEAPEQVVRRRTRNYGSFWKTESYLYHINGPQIHHTRSGGAILTGCVYDYTARAAAYDASGNSPMPEGMETMWVAHVLVNLPQENWLVQEAGYYLGVYNMCEADLKSGTAPTPQLRDQTATPEPIKN